MEKEDKNDESEMVDHRARLYQEQLFEKARKNNTIICLKTGAGKTFIAIMLIKEFQHEIKMPFADNGKRTFFLVPKVPLVSQQAKAIRTHTILRVGEYCGADGVDAWTEENWNAEFTKYEVLVMTAQILVNILSHNFLSLNRVNLLIFDECHMAIGNSPYCDIMARYQDVEDHPRILGLTASILNKKVKPCSVEIAMRQLEVALHSRIESANDLELVNRYATKPKEIIIVCNPPNNISCTERTVNEILKRCTDFMDPILEKAKSQPSKSEDLLDVIKKARNVPEVMALLKVAWEEDDAGSSDIQEAVSSSPFALIKYVTVILQTLGLWCTKIAVDKFLEEIPKYKREAEEQLQPNNVCLLDIIDNGLLEIKNVLHRHFQEFSEKEILMNSISPRVQRMIELLSVLAPVSTDGSEFRGIVFVQQRIIARALCDYLLELARCVPETFGYLNPCYIVGHGANVIYSKQSAMTMTRQAGVLQSFRMGVCNLMVATQVVEEGIDVPKCNLVFRFDPPRNFTSYVQSMGRARAEKALYILLVDPDEKSLLMDDITCYKMVECILNSKSHSREPPTADDAERFYNDYHKLPPYYPGRKDGAVLSLNSALGILNRYCNRLPHDRYTIFGPKFKYTRKEDDTSLISCSITLPFTSSIREPVKGLYMSDKKLARKAAAHAVCIRLHREGELNDHLMPAVNYIERYQSKLGIVPMELYDERDPTPGTKKRRQAYEKEIAEDLSDCFPSIGRDLYLYAICIHTNECDETIGEQSCFGILTSKPISDVCPFVLYGKTRYILRLQCMLTNVKVNKKDLKALESFHRFIFQDVLHVASAAMQYCPHTATFSLLIVPIKGDNCEPCIDWELIARCQYYQDADNEVGDTLDEHPVKGDVLLPQYGDGLLQNRRFYVLCVCEDLNPDSPFSNPSVYTSYAAYFKDKYKKSVADPSQPLVRVDYVPNTLNVLHPLEKNPTSNKKREQYQIPEFCKKYPLNIHRVSQAYFLPSILHRLNGLLLAKQLRDRIIVEANLPLEINASSENLLPLELVCNSCKIEKDTIFSYNIPCSETDPTTFGALIFQALTTSSADNWSDLERLEVVGDSFLKYSISVLLFCTIENINEGGLSTLRTGMVKNFNLYSHAKTRGIPGLLNASMFQPRLMWLPPCYRFPPELSDGLLAAKVPRHLWSHALLEDVNYFENDEKWIDELTNRWKSTDSAHRETALNEPKPTASVDSSFDDNDGPPCSEIPCNYFTHQFMGDKTIADVAEAIIGAVLLCCGQSAALHFIEWLGLNVQADAYPWTTPSTALVKNIAVDKLSEVYVGLDDLEAQLGYTFREKSFLRQALIHPSYMRKQITDNYQRLEFLGDAILDFLITMHLYKLYPNLSPGDMTDLRSSLVDNVTFGYLTVKNNLHKHLKYNSQNLYQVIDRYIKHTENITHPKEASYVMKENETIELEEVEIPKALGDVFEAIAGAIFIDSNLSLEAVWKVYYPMMKDAIDKYSQNLPINPIRVLMEHFPDTKFSKPSKPNGYYTVEVVCNGKLYYGMSKNKTFAKQAAAKSALRSLNIASTRTMS